MVGTNYEILCISRFLMDLYGFRGHYDLAVPMLEKVFFLGKLCQFLHRTCINKK